MMDYKVLKNIAKDICVAGEVEKLFDYKTPYSRIRETASELPNKLAINYFGWKCNFAEFVDMIDTMAKGLLEIGLDYGEPVAFCSLPTPYSIATFYALDKIGAMIHLINGVTDANEIKRELKDVNPKVFIGNDLFCSEERLLLLKNNGVSKFVFFSLTDLLPKTSIAEAVYYTLAEKKKGLSKKVFGNDIVFSSKVYELGSKSNKVVIPYEFDKDKIVTIAYTSGSTGNSKAVAASCKSIDSMVHVNGMTEEGRYTTDDIMFVGYPMWIYYVLMNMIHEPLSLGMSLALDPLFDVKNLSNRSKKYKITHFLAAPMYIKKLSELNKKLYCANWKSVIAGGDELPGDVKDSFDAILKENGCTTQVLQGYGTSECLGSFAFGYYDNPTSGSVGKPCIGNMIKIVDQETGEECGPGETGLGYLYSPTLMKCYYNNDEANAKSLIPDENGVLWYNTEDLFHKNERGELFLDGRVRRVVMTYYNNNPVKIFPEKVRKAISEIADVRQCEVITVPDAERNNVCIAFVILNSSANDESKARILKHCKQSMPEYMVPKDIIVVESIPSTSSGKPDLKLLQHTYINSQTM